MNQKGKKEMTLILKVKGNCLQKQSNQGNDNYIYSFFNSINFKVYYFEIIIIASCIVEIVTNFLH